MGCKTCGEPVAIPFLSLYRRCYAGLEASGNKSLKVTWLMAVAVADDHLCAAQRRRTASVTRPRQHSLEFLVDQLFDQPADPIAHRALDRIKPVVEKMG